MKSTSVIKEFVRISLLVAAAAGGCGSSPQGDKVDGPATGGGPGSAGGAVTGSGGLAGQNDQSGTGGVVGTGGASTGAAGAEDAAVAPDGAAGGPPDVGTSDAGGPTPGSDAGSAPCTGGTIRPGNSTVMIQHGGAARNYIMHVPASYTGKTRVPLVIDMHGSGQSASAQIGASTWGQKADAVGFIIIYPNALNARWNAGTCCSPSMEQNVDDLGFIRAVVDKTTTDGCIDRKRVYAGGLSGGGLMAYRLACLAADMFAGIAPVSGTDVTMPCMPSAPVTVVSFRGLMDTTVPYNGGMPLRWLWPSAKADFDQFSQLDQCTGPVTVSHNVCQTKTQCAGGTDVTLCSIHGGHVLYGAAVTDGASVPDTAWEIFQHRLSP
jgi:polyhydroxybutyrate depolymerase